MATEKLHLLLGVNRDFGVGSGGGDSIEISSANAGFDVLFTESVVFGSSAQLQHSKYSMGRQDLGAGAGATLTIQPRNSHWAFRSGYRYDWTQFQDSGTTHDYKNHNVSLGTSYRY